MIPKTIHYCWFGKGAKPALAEKCIASWARFCPDYQIVEWNEENFPVDDYPYAQYCLQNKKYAFLSDFARLEIISIHGGIYYDTDVELIKSPDNLLEDDAFYGFENDDNIATGLGFGAIPHHPTVEAMADEYRALLANEDGNYPMIVCPALNTRALLKFGLQLDGREQFVAGAHILSVDYLNPYDSATGVLRKTPNTISVHWYGQSWMSKKAILRSKLTRPFHRAFGVNCFDWLKKK